MRLEAVLQPRPGRRRGTATARRLRSQGKVGQDSRAGLVLGGAPDHCRIGLPTYYHAPTNSTGTGCCSNLHCTALDGDAAAGNGIAMIA